jgi:hypothetical protein
MVQKKAGCQLFQLCFGGVQKKLSFGGLNKTALFLAQTE